MPKKKGTKTMVWFKNVRMENEHYVKTEQIDSVEKDKKVFLCYETDVAFAHWVFQDFIQICHWKENHDFDGLNHVFVHLLYPREFKSPFLHSIGFDTHSIVSGDLPTENYCWFPDKQWSLNDKMRIDEIWLDQFESWIETIKSNMSKERIHFVILPRQHKESYKPNDRQIFTQPMVDYISHCVQEQRKKLAFLHTDQVTQIEHQIHTVGSADYLLLDAASSFFVNGMFAKHATIFAIGPWRQHTQFPILHQIYEHIIRSNKVIWINPVHAEPGKEYHDASIIKEFYPPQMASNLTQPFTWNQGTQYDLDVVWITMVCVLVLFGVVSIVILIKIDQANRKNHASHTQGKQ